MQNRRGILTFIFFVSGFCSLLYQVVWQRLFGLVCSSDNVTASLVVAAFLFGLGAGSFAGGRLTHVVQPRTAFRLLAVCETLITLFAFVSPAVYYDFLFTYFIENSVSLFHTFIILFVSLLPPTFLMGMSMPLLGRAVVEKAENTASVLGDLYAANIVGAGTGAFVTAFWILGTLGMEFALYFGGLLNLGIALALWIIPHGFRDRREPGFTVDWKAWLTTFALGAFILPDRLEFPFLDAFLPGLFMLACALFAPRHQTFLGGRMKYAAVILVAVSAFAAGNSTFFLPAIAALAFVIRYGSTDPGSPTRLGKEILLTAVTALLAWGCGSNDWTVFHYLVGARWLFGECKPDSKRGGQIPFFLGSALVFCLPKLLVGQHWPAASAFLGVASFFMYTFIETAESAPCPDDSRRKYLVPILACAFFIWATTGETTLGIAAALTGWACLELWRSPPPERDVRFSLATWMVLAFASGFIAVSMELVWFRTLFTHFEGNSYVFGPMLAVFLLCDGLGMWVAAKMVRKTRNHGLAFLSAQISAVSLALLMYTVFIGSVYWKPSMLGMTGASLFLMGIPCFFLGFTFPFIQEAIQDNDGDIGSRVGLVLFFNTLGNTAGGIVAAFVLLGLLGTIGSLFAFGAFVLALAISCVAGKFARTPMAIMACSVIFLCSLLPDNNRFWMKIHGITPSYEPIVAEDYSGVCMISVHKTTGEFFLDRDIKERGSLFVSGHRQGNIPFGRNQTISGVIGVAFHPDPRDVLCIGIGSASTPYLMGMRRTVTRIDMVELAEAEIPALIAATKADFGRFLEPIFSDPRYRLHIADGRKFLFGAGKYDIIQADMRKAESAGSGALYSREFFEHAARHLKPGGYFIQQTFGKTTLSTMQAVFPYVYAHGFFAIASNQPIELSNDRLFAYLENELSPNLAKAGLNPAPVRSILLASFQNGGFVEPAPPAGNDSMINTDLLPVDEFYLNTPLVLRDLSPRRWIFNASETTWR